LLLDFSKFAEFSSSPTPLEKRASPYSRPYILIHERTLVWRLQSIWMWCRFLR